MPKNPLGMADLIEPDEGGVSIGFLSKSTGISVDTLRVWERRYGSPMPRRLSSGHRRYSMGDVERLQSVAKLLERGYRPSELLARPSEALALLGRSTSFEAERALGELLEAVATYDDGGLRKRLLEYAEALPSLIFLEELLAPWLRRIGEGWAEGTLDVAHEHFATRVAGDVLGELRSARPACAQGTARLVLASLPGEQHALALDMIAYLCDEEGVPCHVLGANTPLASLVEMVEVTGSNCIALHVSSSGAELATEQLGQLGAQLDSQVRLLVGGAGQALLPAELDVVRFVDLASFLRWITRD